MPHTTRWRSGKLLAARASMRSAMPRCGCGKLAMYANTGSAPFAVFAVRAEELHGGSLVAKHQTVPASNTNIHLAGKQGQTIRLWYPPLLEQFCLGPRLEHEARRALDGSRGNELALGLPFHRRAVLRG